MSLTDLCSTHRVDIVSVDDSGIGERGGKTQARSTAAAAVPCRIEELSATTELLFDREQERITHRVKFAGAPTTSNGQAIPLDTTYELHAADRDNGGTRVLRVTGWRRPRFQGGPWVALAREIGT